MVLFVVMVGVAHWQRRKHAETSTKNPQKKETIFHSPRNPLKTNTMRDGERSTGNPHRGKGFKAKQDFPPFPIFPLDLTAYEWVKSLRSTGETHSSLRHSQIPHFPLPRLSGESPHDSPSPWISFFGFGFGFWFWFRVKERKRRETKSRD